MPSVTMARQAIKVSDYETAHAGLLLDRYLPQWPDDKTQKGEEFAEFIEKVCKQSSSEIYKEAYQRWNNLLVRRQIQQCAALWCGKLDGRLMIGMGGASVLEAAIRLHHSYGVPLLPGSALKGLVRAYALAKTAEGTGRISQQECETLFGREPEGEESGDAGYVIFHDAWWIPSSQPALTPEIVTVHHPQYYATQGASDASDFDAPTPNAQIAVQGSFLFAVEGAKDWAEFGIQLLQAALQHWGAGAKTAAGYGYFVEDAQQSMTLKKALGHARLGDLTGKELLSKKWEAWSADQLAVALGKNWNKTKEQAEILVPGIPAQELAQILESLFCDVLSSWANEPDDSNCHKAFKRWRKLRED